MNTFSNLLFSEKALVVNRLTEFFKSSGMTSHFTVKNIQVTVPLYLAQDISLVNQSLMKMDVCIITAHIFMNNDLISNSLCI